jgi:hypothetical protein
MPSGWWWYGPQYQRVASRIRKNSCGFLGGRRVDRAVRRAYRRHTGQRRTARLGRTLAALAAVVVLSAALAAASPGFAQLTPSPDPDPQVRPDPVTTTSHTTPSPQPVTRAPVVRSAPQPVSSTPSQPATVTATVPQSSSPRTTASAGGAHPTRRASKPHPERKRTGHAAAVAAWRRLAVPRFPPLAAEQAGDRSQARELSLAAIALLLVVIAGGSLLRMTRDVQRGRPA